MILVIEPWAYWLIVIVLIANAAVGAWKAWVWRSLLKKESVARVLYRST